MDFLNNTFDKVQAIVSRVEKKLAPVFEQLDTIENANQLKVLNAFREERVSTRLFMPSYGYGYDDIGRDSLDRVFARVFETQDAIVRPQIVSGTHAIFTALAGLLKPGNSMLSITGAPYDTLLDAIGITGEIASSLTSLGVSYSQIELDSDNKIDLNALKAALLNDSNLRVVYIQRSRGYSWRNALLPEEMRAAIELVHGTSKDAVVVVDNCYGEFTCIDEPTTHGADVIVGSLIKNPGGGIAPTGGYICGRRELIEEIAFRLTVPGIGKEVGSYASSYAPFYQGIFLAPHVTIQALKTAVLFAGVFEEFGLNTMPASTARRSDIVQALRFPNDKALISFIQRIQSVSPVDSFVSPEPWEMPGYADKVIMAAGTFVQGASIELSADAPICKPYTAYIQGALTYSHGKIAVMEALNSIEGGSLHN